MSHIKSIEEKIEDLAKQWLGSYKCRYFTKAENVNSEIDDAMRKAPSKRGGTGGNYPDIRLLLIAKNTKIYPIMIEIKGKKDRLVKLNSNGEIDNSTATNEPNYKYIDGYAVNGAIHYAKAILDYTDSYKEVIAIGLTGYSESDSLKVELGVYYMSSDNLSIPKKVGSFSDLSFLAPANFEAFIKQVEQLKLTPDELEAQSRKIEERIEKSLKSLNQTMHDDLNIAVSARVQLIAGMIMAGLGVPEKVAPLEICDLKGQIGPKTHDGIVIINRISDFLTNRDIPQEKRDMIVTDLSRVFVHSNLWNLHNGESKIKTVFKRVKSEILPIFISSHHLDFTGKLFNVLNDWVDVPDAGRNDVVLTPRYVTTMMAKLAKVDRNSYVWDYAAGSAGFLISSMKLMIEDAEMNVMSPNDQAEKIINIKAKQLLGIEKLPDMYLLAVLNMILMEDGTAHILHKDSLKDYNGTYEWGIEKDENGNETSYKDKKFPANVFLLNPPYSAEGKGFIFVEKALSRMLSGMAVVLIQENAGGGSGLPFTKNLLKNNTLLASIHMADIFRGKVGVQTAVYVFEVGKAHNTNQIVKFIDMTNDGYSRQNRKKSGLDVNLRNTDHALERYQEVVDIVNDYQRTSHYYSEVEIIEDTITLEGNDWMFSQHKRASNLPTEEDFIKIVKEYLAWEAEQILKEAYNA